MRSRDKFDGNAIPPIEANRLRARFGEPAAALAEAETPLHQRSQVRLDGRARGPGAATGSGASAGVGGAGTISHRHLARGATPDII